MKHSKQLIFTLLMLISLSLHASFEEAIEAQEKGSYNLAVEKYQAAADAGDIRAFGRLAGMYLYGVGVEKDYKKAYIWFGMAAASGDIDAAKFQRAAASTMTMEQVKESMESLEDYKSQFGIESDQ